MRVATTLFRIFLAAAWLVLLWVSIQAVARLGMNASGPIFIGDFGHPWRAQFNTDFSFHLLLVAAWMVYRARSWGLGLVCGFLAIMLGGEFTLAYLLVVSLQTRGDVRRILLGRHMPGSIASVV